MTRRVPLAGSGERMTSPQAQLGALNSASWGFPVSDLNDVQARGYLLALRLNEQRPADQYELNLMAKVVGGWQQAWSSPAGEYLLPLMALTHREPDHRSAGHSAGAAQ